MDEFLKNLLYACITCVLPILVKYLITFINVKIARYTEKMDNEKNVEYIYMAVNMIEKIVTEVSQTYVDELKKAGTFTTENQETAKQMALDKADTLITEEVKTAIETLYGDFQTWANTVIEASVRKNKV